MNLGFYILFLVMLTTMTVLLAGNSEPHKLLDIPRFTIVVMSLFHLLKEIFQIWDEVRTLSSSSIERGVWVVRTRGTQRENITVKKLV